MQKKKDLLIVLGSIILLVTIFSVVDYFRVKDGKSPFFAIKGATYRDGGSADYFGVGYKIIQCHTLSGDESIHFGFYNIDVNELCNNNINSDDKENIPNNDDDDDDDDKVTKPNNYDTSSFKEIYLDKFFDIYASDELSVIFIGRHTCMACVYLLDTLKEIVEEYGLDIYYLSLVGINTSSDEYQSVLELDKYLHYNLGYTPMILIVKGSEIINGKIGNMEYEEVVSHFKKYELIK